MMVYDGCHLIIGEFLMINVEVEGSKGYKSPIAWKIKLYNSMNWVHDTKSKLVQNKSPQILYHWTSLNFIRREPFEPESSAKACRSLFQASWIEIGGLWNDDKQ